MNDSSNSKHTICVSTKPQGRIQGKVITDSLKKTKKTHWKLLLHWTSQHLVGINQLLLS
jgi:hypothetical protein